MIRDNPIRDSGIVKGQRVILSIVFHTSGGDNSGVFFGGQNNSSPA